MEKCQMPEAFCECCGKKLSPAPARWDGEPTYVGFIPCACNRPIMTEFGVVYPGEDQHNELLRSGRYSINDLLTPVSSGKAQPGIKSD